MQLPSFGAGPSLYIPLAGIALLVVYGQVSAQVQKGTRGWTPTVRSRVRSTYAHFGASISVWVASAIFFWKLGLVPSNVLHLGLAFAASIFTIYKLSTLDYTTSRAAKTAYFLLFAGLQGLNLAGILRVYASAQLLYLVFQAAAVTFATVTATTVAVAASPSTNFLVLAGPVAAGMGLVLGADLVNLLFGSRAVHSAVSYLGAAVFAGHLLLDAHRLVKEAKAADAPPAGDGRFDPIRHALQLYLDTVNLFIYILRIVTDQDDEANGSRARRASQERPSRGELQLRQTNW